MSEKILNSNSRFRALLRYGEMMSAVGWVLVVVGGIMFFMGFTGCLSSDPFAKGFGMISLSIGILVATMGFMIVVNGEAVTCFVSIGHNTFDIAQNFPTLIDNKSNSGEPPPEGRNDTESKFCYKCGEPIVDGYNFCKGCGTKLK